MNVFLDDTRVPSDVYWVDLPMVEWKVVKNYEDFIRLISSCGLPRRIAFDHDLAEEHYHEYHRAIRGKTPGEQKFRYDQMKEKTGLECVQWLTAYCAERGHQFPEYYVHTMNSIGKDNIIQYIENYKKNL